jgi:hypothetical protein
MLVFDVSPTIQEVSGAVFDLRRSVVWTHGDSGTGPVIGRTTMPDGTTIAIQVQGAKNVDWEAIVQDARGALWILDVGDNDRTRPEVLLYRVDPDAIRDGSVSVDRTIRVTYKDGARNVEAAALDGERLYLFEKVYVGVPRVASVDLSEGDVQVARPEGKLFPIGPITDASVTSKGAVYFLTYFTIQSCEACFDPDRRRISTARAGIQGQAESLIALDGNQFLVGFENGQFHSW